MSTATTNPFSALFAGLDRDPESLAFEFAERFDREIHRAMKAQGVNRKQLAERMGVSAPRMTKILSGEANLTVKTMVSMALALELRVEPKLLPLAPAAQAVPEVKMTSFRLTAPLTTPMAQVSPAPAFAAPAINVIAFVARAA